jgi:ribonuclease HI
MGVGIVLRDSEGMAALATVIPFILDPTTAEVMAAWQAIILCRELGISHVIFEGDPLSIVLALSTKDPYWCRYGHVVEDARVRIGEIDSMEVQHVRRCANQAAHNLAKSSLRFLLD